MPAAAGCWRTSCRGRWATGSMPPWPAASAPGAIRWGRRRSHRSGLACLKQPGHFRQERRWLSPNFLLLATWLQVWKGKAVHRAAVFFQSQATVKAFQVRFTSSPSFARDKAAS